MTERRPRIVDLSVPLVNNALYDPIPPAIQYVSHRAFARNVGRTQKISPNDFPDGLGLAQENVTLGTHSGTHVDAPWHYGPTSEGKPAKTIDQVPLDWCYGDGVRLDLKHKKTAELITPADLEQATTAIGYEIKPWDIVLVWTGIDHLTDEPEFWEKHAGLSPAATAWLLNRGVKIIGIDAWGLDNPYHYMFTQHRAGIPNSLWPSHLFGREREYLQIEKVHNLAALPGPTGFKVAAFPIKIEGASGAWCRCVAILDN